MKKTWFVLDGDNNPAWDSDNERPKEFKSFAAAEKEAKDGAEFEPGKKYKIVGVEAVAYCDISVPKIHVVK